MVRLHKKLVPCPVTLPATNCLSLPLLFNWKLSQNSSGGNPTKDGVNCLVL